MKYRVKNWRQFQHYRDRNPPWIKLHFAMLSSRDWVSLDDASRVLAVACMLIASRNDGEIDGSEGGLEYMQRVAYLHKKPNLKPLIDCGFLESASNLQADASAMLADARPETETQIPTEEEKPLSGKPDLLPQSREVLEFLNAKTGRAYKPVAANLDMIRNRLKEGYTVSELRQVVAKKCREWGSDEKMAIYLRPATLFNKTNLAQYSGELVVPGSANA